ncbi:MAG: HAMP domain-containing histidine kinase [Bacteroidales bacterium]|nr:HAMP domain-containing histidine kinase [Bacteroidales bacterium]MBN2758089.1 HAMP domain-containing histidine kinase [Bacteroidales bacterium]
MSNIKITDELLIEELKIRFEEKKNSLEKLEKLTKELKEVNKKLGESEALKSHFISNITNEIVNPFTSIVVLSKNITLVKEGDWEKVNRMARLIHSEAFNLDFQLKNIFVAAEIESGELFMEVSNVKVDQLIESVIESFTPETEKKQLKFEFITDNGEDRSFTFKTDSEKLRIILSNLVDNAVKFSKNNKIIIRRWLEGKELFISVQDFGIGISEKNQQVIFDRFKRLDSGINSLNRGHGLGLSINKAILDFLDGDIKIKSEKNSGTVFTVSIPEPDQETGSFSADGNEMIFGDDEIF